VPEDKVLKIFVSEGKKMSKEWRILCNEELDNLHLSSIGMIKGRRMGWVGHLTYTREGRSSYTVFVGKSEVKKPTFKFS
jgi:hypothetical protein